jgi:hypothetical protein
MNVHIDQPRDHPFPAGIDHARIGWNYDGGSISNLFDPVFFNEDCAVPDLTPVTNVQKRGAFDGE